MKKEYNNTFVILYDEDERLFYCKVGLVNEKNSPLHYTVWGKTEDETLTRANSLISVLHNQQAVKVKSV